MKTNKEENIEKILKKISAEKLGEAVQIIDREGAESGAKYIMEALQEWMDTVRYSGDKPLDETKRLFTKTRFDRGDVEIVGGLGMAYRGMVKSALIKTVIWEKRLRTMQGGGFNTRDYISYTTDDNHPMGKWRFTPTNDKIPKLETQEEVNEMVEEILLQKPLLVEDLIQGFALANISLDGASRKEMETILGPWPKPEYLEREIEREGNDNRLRDEMK